jgi:putative NADH-flavin reductase
MSKAVEKVAIFGATGQTGLCCIEHALKKGKLSFY